MERKKKVLTRSDAKKELFLKKLEESCGIIAAACKNADVPRQTYYTWYRNDENFREKCLSIYGEQFDFVESQLLKNIKNGDTTAMIFYIKRKDKERKDRIANQQVLQMPDGDALAQIEKFKARITDLMKSEGKYRADLEMQADIAAQFFVRADYLRREIYTTVNLEPSKDGTWKESVNSKERLYIYYLQCAQRALKALGLNIDSKERNAETDVFADFIDGFRDEERNDDRREGDSV